MATDLQFDFRLVEFDNLLRYQEIVDACFGRRPNEQYFRWKYLENPAGQLIAFEALHEGRVAGFYGVIPWHFDVSGRRRLFHQSMDTMTHPDYQRRGLFVKLANLTYAELARRFPDYVLFGIPGTTSYAGFVQKLGWSNPFSFKYLFTPRALFQSVRRLRAPCELETRPVTTIDDQVRDYFERRDRGELIGPTLSAEFLRWRVLDNQNFSYSWVALHQRKEMVGFAVYRKDEEQRAFVEMVDWVSTDYWERPCLPAMIDHIFRATGARYVFTWEPTRIPIVAAYRRTGFLTNPFGKGPFSYRVPFIVRSPNLVCDGRDLSRRASYDLQPLMQD